MRVPSLLALMAFVLVACGSDEPADTTQAANASSSTTLMTSTSTSTSVVAPTTTLDPATTTTSQEIDVEFRDGEVSGPDLFEVDLGETVDIRVVSDVDDELHVHGYDLFYDLDAGEPVNLSFPADVPGIFEVEVHTGHTVLFELRVSG